MVVLPAFRPKPGKAKSTVEEKEGSKNYPEFLRHVVEPVVERHVYPQDKIQENNKPGEVFGNFLHSLPQYLPVREFMLPGPLVPVSRGCNLSVGPEDFLFVNSDHRVE